MQVYAKTNTVYCFSTSCETHGKSLDVIDFIMHKEKCSKHEAIMKAKQMIQPQQTDLPRIAVLTKIFKTFSNGLAYSKPAQEYLQSRHLDRDKIAVGYNSGQFHYVNREDRDFVESCKRYGLLLDQGVKSRTGNTAYKPFGKNCIVFPLKNQAGQITSLYFRSVTETKNQKHYYLKNREGLYPSYPHETTRRLILTESIIDAATLITHYQAEKDTEVLTLYGTNGLTAEHRKVINELPELEEIILWMDGDEAGRAAIEKYAPALKTSHPKIAVTVIDTAEGEDINSLLEGHESSILAELLKNRRPYSSSEIAAQRTDATNKTRVQESKVSEPLIPGNQLDTTHPHCMIYRGRAAKYLIKGFRSTQLDSLKITVQIIAA